MIKRILMCDDECHILHAAEIKFCRAGFEIRTADDGQEAWEILYDEGWMPDVLITDCQMPRLDGIGLCQRCRAHEATRDLPILMLTAKGLELPHDQLATQLNVLAVLGKPFSPRELLHCVQQIIETGRCTIPKAYL
jgi:two-component system alkaline phosphatase synthesis response regulator PhoP